MQTVALLLPANGRLNHAGVPRSKVGGADMRFDSLERAIGDNAKCIRIVSRCDHGSICRVACGAGGPALPGTVRTGWYYDSTYCPAYADGLLEQLLAGGVSTVVISSLEAYRYVLHFAKVPELKVVFDMHNVEYNLHSDMRRTMPPGSRMDSVLTTEYVERLQIAERAAVEATDEVWTCTPDDRDLVQALYGIPGNRIRVLPDVVDVSADPPKSLPPTHGVFTARLDYYPNIVAAQTIFNEIAPLVHPFPLVVAGAQPGDDLTNLPRPDNAVLVADPPVIGDVIAGGIAVVPLTHGGGSRFKVIEAFAAGVPVVSSLKGAEGLASQPGVHYLRAETPEEFADSIRRLHSDDDLRSRIVLAAWHLAREQYSIEALRNALNAGGGRV